MKAIPSDKTNPERESLAKSFRIETMASTKELLAHFRNEILSGSVIVEKCMSEIIDRVSQNPDLVAALNEIRKGPEDGFRHSIAVCIYSLVTGLALGYSTEELKALATGAFLHDVGKSLLPEKIGKKSSKFNLSDFKVMKTHPDLGYGFVSGSAPLAKEAAMAILQHHERCDGSGYPLRLNGRDIHEFARIVAVADVFDALSSDRTYRKRWSPDEIFEHLTMGENDKFDPGILDVFIRNVPMYPPGAIVFLNSGETGVVLRNHRNYPTRPIVRVVAGPDGALSRTPLDIDLADSYSLYITGIAG